MFCLLIGGLFYISFAIKIYLKSKCVPIFLFSLFQTNHILLCFITITPRQNIFQYDEAKITLTKKWWFHAYWFVCMVLYPLRSQCFVCEFMGYFASFLRSKCYYNSKSVLLFFCFCCFNRSIYYSVPLKSVKSKSRFDTSTPKEHDKNNGEYINTICFALFYTICSIIA